MATIRPAAAAAGVPATVAARRGLVLVLVAAAIAVAVLVARPQPALLADPELARLMRGMAAIKGLIALGALGLVWWRVARPITAARLAAYALGTAVLAAAAVTVAKLAVVAATSVVFHATLLALALTALGDGGGPQGRLARPSVRPGRRER